MTTRRKRVGLVAVLQETNTFAQGTTNWEDFQEGIFLRGEEIAWEYQSGNHEVSGFFSGLKKERLEPVPILFAFAAPGPPVSAGALERIWKAISNGLEKAEPLDGCLVAAGGAAVSENHCDMDGWWLAQLRRVLGNDKPVLGTLDPHAHISEQMLLATDALLPYRTNPHLDQKQRGEKAARLMAATLRGEIRPQQKFCRLPLIINIEKQSTEFGPLASVMQACIQEEDKAGVLDASLVLGFPYGDVPEMASGALVVADRDPALARESALRLGTCLWKRHRELRGDFRDPETAVRSAETAEPPVLLLDMGDNIGGGATGDGTWLLHLLNGLRDRRSFICLHDPAAAAVCRKAGAGAGVSVTVGGWSDSLLQGKPLALRGIVKSLPAPSFQEENPRHGGWKVFDMGGSALLENREGHLSILLTSRRVAPFSAGFLSAMGLKVEDFDFVVAKGVHGPLGAFGPLCKTVIRVNTSGITCADLSTLVWKNRSSPMEPFEESLLTAALLP